MNKYNNQYNIRKQQTQRILKNRYHFVLPSHQFIWFCLIFFLIICCFGLPVAHNTYSNARNTFKKTYKSSNSVHLRNVSQLIKQKRPFSVLLLGTDTGAIGRHDKGRTDSMILAAVNPQKGTTYLTSIPRDTETSLPNDSQNPDKINNAYTLGGPTGAINAVQKLLNVPIDYYAVINMGGLEKMVNAVNGVSVTPPLSFNYGATHVKKNKTVVLRNRAALDYARMRHQDPQGDYGRQLRQRQMIQSLVMKGLQISSLLRYKKILKSLQGNLETDVQFDDMMAIRTEYRPASHHIQSIDISEHNQTINGIDFQAPDKDNIKKVSSELRKGLDISNQADQIPDNNVQ